MKSIILAAANAPAWRRRYILALGEALGWPVLVWDGGPVDRWSNGEASPQPVANLRGATFEGHVEPKERARLRAEGFAVADPPGLAIEDEARYRALQTYYKARIEAAGRGVAP